jgi:enoyl-CoA hydratase/carnithine racemase
MIEDASRWGLSEVESVTDGLLLGRVGHVTVVLLDRPERRNAFTSAIMAELGPLWQRLDTDGSTRCIVFGTTSDSFFCSGIDVKEVAKSGEAGVDLPWGRGPHLTTKHAHVFTPVICAVEGAAVGGGLHFVLDADVVIAGQSATFFDTHTMLGMVGATETVGLVAKAGLGAALYFALGGTRVRIGAEHARSLGLVQEVVPDGTALQAAIDFAGYVATTAPSATKKTVEIAWAAASLGMEDGLRFGRAVGARQREHPDWREGPRAFAEKRAPAWRDA